MVLNIPDNGLLLESSPEIAAGLPAQAFAITLSQSVIEDMIACVQNGGDIQLALGANPVCGVFVNAGCFVAAVGIGVPEVVVLGLGLIVCALLLLFNGETIGARSSIVKHTTTLISHRFLTFSTEILV
jgi:hypothetical protein